MDSLLSRRCQCRKGRRCQHKDEVLCAQCEIPVCCKCESKWRLRENHKIPMCLGNDNFWGYTTDTIVKHKVTWLESAIVSPCRNHMLVYYVEGDSGHLMHEIVGAAKYRAVVRGSCAAPKCRGRTWSVISKPIAVTEIFPTCLAHRSASSTFCECISLRMAWITNDTSSNSTFDHMSS